MWIKVRTNLHTDPRVRAIAARLQIPTAQVVGGLVALWSIADEHSTDGRLPYTTAADVNALAGCDKFANALADVGWLDSDAQRGVVVPRFEEHNGASAKKRAADQRRKATTRRKGL